MNTTNNLKIIRLAQIENGKTRKEKQQMRVN